MVLDPLLDLSVYTISFLSIAANTHFITDETSLTTLGYTDA